MGKPLRCLSFGVQRQNEEAGGEIKAYQNGSHSHSKKNPFFTLGPNKFSSLLTFIYSNSSYWVPIIVKLRDHKHKHSIHKQKKHNKAAASHDGGQLTTQVQAAAPGNNPINTPIKNKKGQKNSSKATNSTIKAMVNKKNSEISNRNRHNKQMRLERCRPSQYLPIFLVLCLVCLAIFRRRQIESSPTVVNNGMDLGTHSL
ncbi:hypothetical protein NE237_005815 [Protea cynaroides]|uniref:Transmembrane protein n=1 Tax=Protea cynaroides TaxID=273540 RepID=A0A9Q0KLD8_9MAGN|nr:hypothetical protein NE237_005815 [Protea cynaroides]